MRNSEGVEGRKPYFSPVLIVHGDVREITRAANGAGAIDGKVKGNKVFKTA